MLLWMWAPVLEQLLTISVVLLDFEQAAGKYTVMADYEKDGANDFSVKSGDMVQLVKEGEDQQWWEEYIIFNKN